MIHKQKQNEKIVTRNKKAIIIKLNKGADNENENMNVNPHYLRDRR